MPSPLRICKGFVRILKAEYWQFIFFLATEALLTLLSKNSFPCKNCEVVFPPKVWAEVVFAELHTVSL